MTKGGPGINNLSMGDQNTERKATTDSDISQIMAEFSLLRWTKKERRIAADGDYYL
jgi:hypothetical protein